MIWQSSLELDLQIEGRSKKQESEGTSPDKESQQGHAGWERKTGYAMGSSPAVARPQSDLTVTIYPCPEDPTLGTTQDSS